MGSDRRKLRVRPRLLAWMVACGGSVLASSAHANLIVNGDFSAGNTGFSSSYVHYTGPTGSGSTFGPNNYAVDTNPILYNQNYGFGFGDHTTGSGLMMIFDASTSANVTAWTETIPVTPGTSYTFSYWTSAWGNDNHNGIDPSPPRLVTTANSVALGSTFTVPSQDGTWSNVVGTFNSGASSSVTLAISDANTQQTGNDFVLDDISLNPTPEPAGALLSIAVGLLAMRRSRFRAGSAEPSSSFHI